MSKLAPSKVVSREEWLAARKALLAKEKAMTREPDALRAERHRMPWVDAVEKVSGELCRLFRRPNN